MGRGDGFREKMKDSGGRVNRGGGGGVSACVVDATNCAGYPD